MLYSHVQGVTTYLVMSVSKNTIGKYWELCSIFPNLQDEIDMIFVFKIMNINYMKIHAYEFDRTPKFTLTCIIDQWVSIDLEITHLSLSDKMQFRSSHVTIGSGNAHFVIRMRNYIVCQMKKCYVDRSSYSLRHASLVMSLTKIVSTQTMVIYHIQKVHYCCYHPLRIGG